MERKKKTKKDYLVWMFLGAVVILMFAYSIGKAQTSRSVIIRDSVPAAVTTDRITIDTTKSFLIDDFAFAWFTLSLKTLQIDSNGAVLGLRTGMDYVADTMFVIWETSMDRIIWFGQDTIITLLPKLNDTTVISSVKNFQTTYRGLYARYIVAYTDSTGIAPGEDSATIVQKLLAEIWMSGVK